MMPFPSRSPVPRSPNSHGRMWRHSLLLSDGIKQGSRLPQPAGGGYVVLAGEATSVGACAGTRLNAERHRSHLWPMCVRAHSPAGGGCPDRHLRPGQALLSWRPNRGAGRTAALCAMVTVTCSHLCASGPSHTSSLLPSSLVSLWFLLCPLDSWHLRGRSRGTRADSVLAGMLWEQMCWGNKWQSWFNQGCV